MKTLERQFFKYCIKQLNYKCQNIAAQPTIRPMEDIVIEFVEKKKCNEKQLWYYVEKWCLYGIYNYGVSIKCGWFEFDSIIPARYYNIIPDRVKYKLKYFSRIECGA